VEGRAMKIIRPMIYLEEKEIAKIHSYFELPLVDHICPYEGSNKRALYKKGVRELNGLLQTKGFSKKVVKSLENIDLTNIWPEMKKR
jgi:tRNA(Ile)-lysidine synthase TilS/MesJ